MLVPVQGDAGFVLPQAQFPGAETPLYSFAPETTVPASLDN